MFEATDQQIYPHYEHSLYILRPGPRGLYKSDVYTRSVNKCGESGKPVNKSGHDCRIAGRSRPVASGFSVPCTLRLSRAAVLLSHWQYCWESSGCSLTCGLSNLKANTGTGNGRSDKPYVYCCCCYYYMEKRKMYCCAGSKAGGKVKL